MKPNPPPERDAGTVEVITEIRRQEVLLKTGALQNAILNSANFSSIATDERGVIQIFNVGAERMLGYGAADVINKITPADISDPQEVITRAAALSAELGTPITPGFQALVFKASRGIEDIYELTYIRKDGSRFPAVVSVTALRNPQGVIIGYLLIGTDNTARKQVEAEQKKTDQRLRDQQFYTRSLIESNIDAIMTSSPVLVSPRLRTVLYVEDNPANLKLVERPVARRSDLRLLSAGDGNAGFILARSEAPEVILMDINLPGISGIETLRLLREDPLTAQLTVVALSANAMPRDIEKGLQAGFFSYLTKPNKVPEFKAVLDAALEHAEKISVRTE
jgi:CheY-like chemotaxis protein